MKTKQKLRKQLIENRLKLSNAEIQKQSNLIVENIVATAHYKKAQTIFTFHGTPEEVNTSILIEQALTDGKKVALPLVLGKSKMDAYLIDDLSELTCDKFGIMSPDPKKAELVDPKDIDLTIVPLLGYNLRGYRLGYGGGYYDQYLPRLSPSCRKIGVAFDGYEVAELPVHVYDYPLDEILTPAGFVELMARVETHCHCSNFSMDSPRSFNDLLEEAEQKNFKILTLTDHYDKDLIEGRVYPGTKVGSPPRENEWIFSLDEYVDFCLVEKDKLAKRNKKTELLIGIELGYQDYLVKDYQEVISTYPFDLIIGSIHAMYMDDFAVNGESLYGQGKQRAYDAYLRELIRMAESDLDFDILAHFDYVIRYGNFDDPKIYYKDHAELFDRLFNLIIDRGISLEVNTRTRYRQIMSGEEDWGMTDLEIFQRYYDLGGRRISFATDAHSEGELHCLISETIQAFKKIGFDQGTYFKQRQPVFYDLM